MKFNPIKNSIQLNLRELHVWWPSLKNQMSIGHVPWRSRIADACITELKEKIKKPLFEDNTSSNPREPQILLAIDLTTRNRSFRPTKLANNGGFPKSTTFFKDIYWRINTITRAASMEKGKKNKFQFTIEPVLTSKLASPLTTFKKFNFQPLVCWRGLSVLMDTLCKGSTYECDNFGMKVVDKFHFLAIKEEWTTCFPSDALKLSFLGHWPN